MARYLKKRTVSRRRTLKKKTTLATKAYVKSVIAKNIETKILDTQKIEQSSSTVGIPMYQDDMCSFSPSQISGIDGTQCMPKGLAIRYVINNNSTQYGVLVRVLVLKNKLGRNYTAYRNGTDIFEDPTNNYSTTGTLYDISRRINRDRYTVLADKVYKLGYSAVDASSFQHHKLWIKMAGKMQFDGAGISSGTAAPETNNPVVLFISARADNDVALGEIVECTINSSFYFKDA